MAKVSKIIKLKNISAKDYQALYEEYKKEFTRVVSTKYQWYGRSEYNVYENYSEHFDMLSEEQFKTEVDIAKAEGYYGARLVSKIRKLVHSAVKYTMKQNNAVLSNINNMIKKIWATAAGRSVKGRKSKELKLDPEKLTSAEAGLLKILIDNKGDNKNYSEYLIDLTDVIGQSWYFCTIYDYIMQNLVSSGDELYAS